MKAGPPAGPAFSIGANRSRRFAPSKIAPGDFVGPLIYLLSGGYSVDCAPVNQARQKRQQMGKGDQRSRRGKIYRGSFGKSRAKDPAKKKKRAAAKK
jgi:ribosomal small subunit protein bTHX